MTQKVDPGQKDGAARKTAKPAAHPLDGSQLQQVVEEQLFVETAKDDAFSYPPDDARAEPGPSVHGAGANAAPSGSGGAASAARANERPAAPEAPEQGLVQESSQFPPKGN